MQVWLPHTVHQVLPVFLSEVTQIGDKGSYQQDISTQGTFLQLEVFH